MDENELENKKIDVLRELDLFYSELNKTDTECQTDEALVYDYAWSSNYFGILILALI